MLVLIVMIISVALLLALFSGFFPFVNSYGNIMQYTTAYYGAMSAIERGALAVRYAGPGFDGESGRKSQSIGTPINTGKQSDQRFAPFYPYGNGNDALLWSIRSSTDRIPSSGLWNVESAFISPLNTGSRNYNMLSYARTELIPLGTVGAVGSDDYYRKLNTFSLSSAGSPFQIVGQFRLNPFLLNNFSGGLNNYGLLCEMNCPWSPSNDWRDYNQVLATWTIKGTYDGQEFTLLPKDGTDIDLKRVQERDTLIRKNKVTQSTPAPQMILGENSHPFDTHSSSELNIVSNKEEELKNLRHFANILKDTQVSNAFLSFSLANYLWSKGGNLYPFLEYEFHTSDGSRIADRFYTIQGQGKVGSYNVRLQIQKPTLKQPALGNFTIIF